MKHLFPLILIVALLFGAYHFEPQITQMFKSLGTFKSVMIINLVSYAYTFLIYKVYKVGAKIDKKMGNFEFIDADFNF